MRQSSADPLPLRLLVIGAFLLASSGCSPEREFASSTESVPPAPSPAKTTQEPQNAQQSEIAGVRYLEYMTGGARLDERVPMIVVLHPMGGDPADLLQIFRRYRRRARLVLPYGHPSGGLYIWYDSVREDIAAPVVTQEADRIAAALAALVTVRPTIGKPLVTGFSQGGIMTFALAVTHPEALTAAFPISGLLPPSLYPSAALSSRPLPTTLPPIVAFHGAADLAVPTQSARDSIAELQRAGYKAELHEYAGVEHDISAKEEREIFEQLGRADLGFAPDAK